MSVKVTSAAVTPPKEAISDTKAAREGSLVKPKDFDGTTPVEAFLQQIKTCAKYYCWSYEECSIHLRCALTGDAATLVWSQLDPDGLSYQQLQTLLRERYGLANTPHGIGVSWRCVRHERDDGPRLFSRGA